MARTEEEDVNIVEESFVVQEELCQVAQMLAPELLFAPIHLKPVHGLLDGIGTTRRRMRLTC